MGNEWDGRAVIVSCMWRDVPSPASSFALSWSDKEGSLPSTIINNDPTPRDNPCAAALEGAIDTSHWCPVRACATRTVMRGTQWDGSTPPMGEKPAGVGVLVG